ncbi:MAG TPA: hypothetical protein VHA76_00045 [Solirubrobacterales bacterium]|nr:hypothetical protein [Solirubrobacterales bacterium]
MRILALIRTDFDEVTALGQLRQIFAENSFLPVDDPNETKGVLDSLLTDMSADDRHRFLRTLRHLAQEPNGGTVASISLLPEGHVLLRLRNSTLQKLVPGGHRLLETLMKEHGPKGSDELDLRRCEVRERGNREAFLYGYWRGGEASFARFLFAQRRAYFIVLLFSLGLMLEILFSFVDSTTSGGQLGLRLGAPMLVSSLVLILERLAQWRDQRTPRLRWSTFPNHDQNDPFELFPGDFSR